MGRDGMGRQGSPGRDSMGRDGMGRQGSPGRDGMGRGSQRRASPPRRDYDDPGFDDYGMGLQQQGYGNETMGRGMGRGGQGRMRVGMRDGNGMNSRDAYNRSNPNSQYDYQGVAEMGAERRMQRQTAAEGRPMPRTASERQTARRAARGQRREDGVSFSEFEAMFLALFKKQKATSSQPETCFPIAFLEKYRAPSSYSLCVRQLGTSSLCYPANIPMCERNMKLR